MQDKIASPTNFDQYLLAIFAEDEYSIKDDLRLTFGARYNHHEILETMFRQELMWFIILLMSLL